MTEAHKISTSMPTISVITVSYNQGEFIEQNIQSVLNQQYPNIEHIIIDAGSTDGTIDILKKYPHLKWTSEPDRGQSHGLNKGFARATGEIIGWLNSDDWYAEGTFDAVVPEMKDYPLVIGACQHVDGSAQPTTYIPNECRSWHDILKYWVYESCPSQPSIFFTKSLLEEVKIEEGVYVDEDLYFAMDFDLWLRMTKKYPFQKRIDRTLSYFREYDTNKTGKYGASTYREAARVYARHSRTERQNEKSFSYIIPFQEIDDALLKTINSIGGQSFVDSEIILAGYNHDSKVGRQQLLSILELEAKIPLLNIRYIRTEATHPLAAFQQASASACAPTLAYCAAGTTFPPGTNLDIARLFRNDSLALLMPYTESEHLPNGFVQTERGTITSNLDDILSALQASSFFYLRGVALSDIQGFKEVEDATIGFRLLCLQLLLKGWGLNCYLNSSLNIAQESFKLSFQDSNDPLIAVHTINHISELLENDPFYTTRLKHGFAPEIPQSLLDQCKALL